ncbi:Fungal specific transcription factor domain [Ceratobasidium sp. AG-Ba]|nr:Fungal specific transcription factor domain [Ceratobasidium sp. AG-Ba]
MASITPHASYSDCDDHIPRPTPYDDNDDPSAYQFAPLENFDSSLAPADYYRLPTNVILNTQDQTYLDPYYGYPPMTGQQHAPAGLYYRPTWTRPNSGYTTNPTENEYGFEGNDYDERLSSQKTHRKRVSSRAKGGSAPKTSKGSTTESVHSDQSKPKQMEKTLELISRPGFIPLPQATAPESPAASTSDNADTLAETPRTTTLDSTSSTDPCISTSSDADVSTNQIEVTSYQARPEILDFASEELVTELFDIYFNHMNAQCGLLERGFRTLAAIRSRSHFLLTTICAIAAKYYETRPELHLQLSQVARNLAFTVLESGHKSVEVVQAYMLLAIWPIQGRAWLMLGLAIRIAIEMNLHQEPSGSLEVKEKRNRERTWLICYTLDRGISAQTGKPHSIADNYMVRNAGQWWQRSEAIPQDAGVVEYLEFQRMLSRCLGILPSGSGQFDYVSAIDAIESQTKTWSNEWKSRRIIADSEYRSLTAVFYYHYAITTINLFGLQNAVKQAHADIPHFFSRCHSSGMACILVVLDELAPRGYMRYAPDSHFVITSHVAVALLKLIRPEFLGLLGNEQETLQSVQAIADLFSHVAANTIHIPARSGAFLRSLINSKKGSLAAPATFHDSQAWPITQLLGSHAPLDEVGTSGSAPERDSVLQPGGPSLYQGAATGFISQGIGLTFADNCEF